MKWFAVLAGFCAIWLNTPSVEAAWFENFDYDSNYSWSTNQSLPLPWKNSVRPLHAYPDRGYLRSFGCEGGDTLYNTAFRRLNGGNVVAAKLYLNNAYANQAISVGMSPDYNTGSDGHFGGLDNVWVRLYGDASKTQAWLMLSAADYDAYGAWVTDNHIVVAGLSANVWYDVRLTLNGAQVTGEYKSAGASAWTMIGTVNAYDGFSPNYVAVSTRQGGYADDVGCGSADYLDGLSSDEAGVVTSFGWTSPDTKYLQANRADMELRPWSGVIVRGVEPELRNLLTINGQYYGNCQCVGSFGDPSHLITNPLDLGWGCWMKSYAKYHDAYTGYNEGRWYDDSMIQPAVAELQATTFTKFRQNYIHCVSFLRPSYMNFLDDDWWDNISNNMRLLARLAKQGGCKGLAVDTEGYASGLSWGPWTGQLEVCRWYSGMSWGYVMDAARARGRQVMSAINQEYPGIEIVVIPGWSQIANDWYDGIGNDRSKLKDTSYTFLIPFLDGMLEASDGRTRFVDGGEAAYSYSYRQEAEFEHHDTDFVGKYAMRMSTVPGIFRKKVRTGFGLYFWMNWYTPEQFRDLVFWSLVHGKFTWVYSESAVPWWDQPGESFNPPQLPWPSPSCTWTPQTYMDSVNTAREDAITYPMTP